MAHFSEISRGFLVASATCLRLPRRAWSSSITKYSVRIAGCLGSVSIIEEFGSIPTTNTTCRLDNHGLQSSCAVYDCTGAYERSLQGSMKSLEKREEIFKDVQLVITRIVSACILPRLDLIVRANLRHGAKSLPYSSWSIACAQSEADFETTMSDLSSLASSDYAFSQKSCSLSRLTTFTLDVETISSHFIHHPGVSYPLITVSKAHCMPPSCHGRV
jgi:hypothetical protein